MQSQYIEFLEDYDGISGNTYVKGVKYVVKRIKDNCIWFGKDSIPESLKNKVYVIGNIVANMYSDGGKK